MELDDQRASAEKRLNLFKKVQVPIRTVLQLITEINETLEAENHEFLDAYIKYKVQQGTLNKNVSNTSSR